MMKRLATVHFGPENVFVVRTEVDRMSLSMHVHNYLNVQWPSHSGCLLL